MKNIDKVITISKTGVCDLDCKNCSLYTLCTSLSSSDKAHVAQQYLGFRPVISNVKRIK